MIYYIQKKGKGFEIEMCKQVRFRIVADDTHETLGGIGIYGWNDNQDLYLVNVICGHCGTMFEPEEVEILEKSDWWVDLVDTIIGN